MPLVNKVTITPVYGLPRIFLDGEEFPTSQLPFELGQGVSLADISAQMQGADFSVWARDHLSNEDIKQLQQWHYALVHYYDAEQHFQSSPEEESRQLVQKVFIGLRVVRASRIPYQYLQAHVTSDGQFDPFSFSHSDEVLEVPSCDSISPIRLRDAQLLRTIVPALLRAYQMDAMPVRRAIRILELGYMSQGFDVKQLVWATGLDALFTSTENWGATVSKGRIKRLLGTDTPVYDASDFPFITVPSLTIGEVLTDVYRLRNKFAHGEWIPKDFLDEPGYFGRAGESLSYADVLLEATSIILRRSLVTILEHSLLDVFAKKAALDWYFSRTGLVRNTKNNLIQRSCTI